MWTAANQNHRYSKICETLGLGGLASTNLDPGIGDGRIPWAFMSHEKTDSLIQTSGRVEQSRYNITQVNHASTVLYRSHSSSEDEDDNRSLCPGSTSPHHKRRRTEAPEGSSSSMSLANPSCAFQCQVDAQETSPGTFPPLSFDQDPMDLLLQAATHQAMVQMNGAFETQAEALNSQYHDMGPTWPASRTWESPDGSELGSGTDETLWLSASMNLIFGEREHPSYLLPSGTG